MIYYLEKENISPNKKYRVWKCKRLGGREMSTGMQLSILDKLRIPVSLQASSNI